MPGAAVQAQAQPAANCARLDCSADHTARRRQRWLPMALAASLVAGISALLLPQLFRDEAIPAGSPLPARDESLAARQPAAGNGSNRSR